MPLLSEQQYSRRKKQHRSFLKKWFKNAEEIDKISEKVGETQLLSKELNREWETFQVKNLNR